MSSRAIQQQKTSLKKFNKSKKMQYLMNKIVNVLPTNETDAQANTVERITCSI